jgi:uncharacterized protein (DUF58 family)
MSSISSRSAPLQRSFSVPLEGILWLLLSGGMLAISLIKTINLLALLSCIMLALWAWNVVLAWRSLRRLRGQRWIAGPIFAGTPVSVTLELINPEREFLSALRLEDGQGEAKMAWFLPQLGAGELRRLTHHVTLTTRGPRRWGAFRVSTGYPFGLFRWQRALALDEEVIVLPRLGHLHRGQLRRCLPPTGLSTDRDAQQARRHPTAQSEFHGLRAFRSGDSPRWIHWRTSARCGELMVREFEDVPNENLVVVLDLAGARLATLEAAINLTATICWEWCRQKGDHLTLALTHPEPVIHNGITSRELAERLLECLAVLDTALLPTPPGQTDVAERLAERSLPPAPVLVIRTSDCGLKEDLSRRLWRPVTDVDVDLLQRIGCYEPPA